jgi:hypothetical protein
MGVKCIVASGSFPPIAEFSSRLPSLENCCVDQRHRKSDGHYFASSAQVFGADRPELNEQVQHKVPDDAIQQYRKAKTRDINEVVQRRIDAILLSDPDNPEDNEALQRWARYGGKTPYSRSKARENSRRFIQGMREALKDDPEGWQEFTETLDRLAERERNGDDQEA